MRVMTLTWYDMPGGFRQCRTGRGSTLSQPDYRHIMRLVGDAAVYSQDHTVDGYAVTTVVPATPVVRTFVRARRLTMAQRVHHFENMAAKAAYQKAVVEKVESTPSIAKRVFC